MRRTGSRALTRQRRTERPASAWWRLPWSRHGVTAFRRASREKNVRTDCDAARFSAGASLDCATGCCLRLFDRLDALLQDLVARIALGELAIDRQRLVAEALLEVQLGQRLGNERRGWLNRWCRRRAVVAGRESHRLEEQETRRPERASPPPSVSSPTPRSERSPIPRQARLRSIPRSRAPARASPVRRALRQPERLRAPAVQRIPALTSTKLFRILSGRSTTTASGAASAATSTLKCSGSSRSICGSWAA